MRTIHEPGRDITVLGEYDEIVCGGGPAGCAAAIASARHGARTLLVEKSGYLGGATVSQIVAVVLSTNGVDFQGIWHAYARRLKARAGMRDLEIFNHGKTHQQIRSCVDPELVKYVWDELCEEAGVSQLLHVYGSMATGEAAGVAAALSLDADTTPRELDTVTVVDRLAADRNVEPAFSVLQELPIAGRKRLS